MTAAASWPTAVVLIFQTLPSNSPPPAGRLSARAASGGRRARERVAVVAGRGGGRGWEGGGRGGGGGEGDLVGLLTREGERGAEGGKERWASRATTSPRGARQGV